jgi:large conductance mechanosensitive channel
VIGLGKFLGSLVDLLLIATSIFLMVKLVNRLTASDQASKVHRTNNLEVLQEIRDILKDDFRSARIAVPVKARDLLTKSGMKIQMRTDRKLK